MYLKGDYEEFILEVEQCDYIICIGAGKLLSSMEKKWKENPICSKIQYIADNSPFKQGKEIILWERSFVIQGTEPLPLCNSKKIVIILTTVMYQEVFEQLQESYGESSINCYSGKHLLDTFIDSFALYRKIPKNLRLCKKMLIPKKIHYCWFGGNPIPKQYKMWMESWKKYCPDYEIIEWNEENYDITKNIYMKQAYEKKKWGFVSDYARLDVIYEQGGIYLDTDVELVRNLDDLLYQKGFAGFESNQYVNFGNAFGAIVQSEYVKGIKDVYEDMTFLDESGEMNLTACPIYQTNYLVTRGLKQNGEYQVLNDEFVVYPEKMFCGKSVRTRRIKLTSYTHGIHHFDASWQSEVGINWKKEKEMMIEQEKDIFIARGELL